MPVIILLIFDKSVLTFGWWASINVGQTQRHCSKLRR